jgi:hypothetical protein
MVFIMVLLPVTGHARVEWATLKKIEIQEKPIDVIGSADGTQFFVLVESEILIFDTGSQMITDRIPIGKLYDKLSYLDNTRTIILSSSKTKSLELIRLDMIYDINIIDRPFKGSADAAVTMVVFDDYQ